MFCNGLLNLTLLFLPSTTIHSSFVSLFCPPCTVHPFCTPGAHHNETDGGFGTEGFGFFVLFLFFLVSTSVITENSV